MLGGGEACPDTAFRDDPVGKVIFGFSSVVFDLASRLFEAGGLSRTLRVLTLLV